MLSLYILLKLDIFSIPDLVCLSTPGDQENSEKYLSALSPHFPSGFCCCRPTLVGWYRVVHLPPAPAAVTAVVTMRAKTRGKWVNCALSRRCPR